MKHLYPVLLMALLASCATAPARVPDSGSLKRFFARCESDLEKAKQVIIQNDLIKNLSHLQFMNSGGNKYYLLERETISALIQSVTEGVYADFILINRQGTVIYTMNNNEIFAKNVRAELKNTVLNASHENRDGVPFIGEVSLLPGEKHYTIAVSSAVSGGDTMPGTFVLIVDISKIQEIIGNRSFIVDSAGNYMITRDYPKINTQFQDFHKINISRPDEEATAPFTGAKGETAWYRLLRYNNLSWIIVSE